MNLVVAERELILEQAQQGINFYNDGLDALGHIIYGEKEAREAVLIGLVARGAVLLAGRPGGGKSLLGRNVYRIYEDATPDDVTIVPPSAQLQDVQLVGGEMSIEKTSKEGDHVIEQTIVTKVDALVKPHTSFLFADELSRVNPTATNALLSAAEEKELRTTAGTVPLTRLQTIISTMNPSESRNATFPITEALTSRHMAGAIMGHDVSRADKKKLANHILPDLKSVPKITSAPKLEELSQIAYNLMLSDNQTDKVVDLVDRGIEQLEQHRIFEAGRMYEQVGLSAKILGLFDGVQPNEDHIRRAYRFAIAARLGARLSLAQARDVLQEMAPLPNAA